MRYILILALIYSSMILATTGCSINQSNNDYCYEKGALSAYIYDPVKNPCNVVFRYRNLSKHMQKPVIDIISYNDADELIKHDTVYFNEIASGASRQISQAIECRGESIARIQVRDARNASRCYGYKCSDLCGINGSSIKVFK